MLELFTRRSKHNKVLHENLQVVCFIVCHTRFKLASSNQGGKDVCFICLQV